MEIKVIKTGSAGNAYLVDDGVTMLALEAGVPFKSIQKAVNYDVRKLRGCLLSHSHKDHSKCVDLLLKYGIDLYASKGTIEEIKATGHRVHAVKHKDKFTVGTFDVMPFDVVHDTAEPLGFLLYSTIEKTKLVFFTDTASIGYKFNDVTHVMAECNFCSSEMLDAVYSGATNKTLALRIIQNHMSIDRLVDWVNLNDFSKLKELHLLHASDANSNEKEIYEKIKNLTGADVYVH